MKSWKYILPLLILASCEKSIPQGPESTEPVFNAIFEVDGNTFEWKAGEEDYYMFTGREKDSMDIAELWGTLQPKNGTPKNAIQFKFRNTHKDQLILDSVFKTGERFLMDSTCGYESGFEQHFRAKPDHQGLWVEYVDYNRHFPHIRSLPITHVPGAAQGILRHSWARRNFGRHYLHPDSLQ